MPNAAHCHGFNLKPHYHLLCRTCGRVIDIPVPYQPHINEAFRHVGEFLIEDHDIVFHGNCPKCQTV